MTTPTTNAPPTPATGDVFLDFSGVVDAVAELGFDRPTLVQVRGWADRKVLPFFKGLDGRRYISRRALVDAFRKMQADAIAPSPTSVRRGRPSGRK